MKKSGHTAFPLHAIAAALAFAAASDAYAFQIDTGNPDLKLRWDNTVRYNLGVRAESQDPRLLGAAGYDESDAKFDRGDIVTNRLDWLTEADLNYRGKFGARISATAWYDHAYRDRSVSSPAMGGILPTSYFGDRYNDHVYRYIHGPSGEILDAFVWSNFNLGDVPVNLKVGRHTNIWGEGLLLGSHAISYSQSPVDGVKAVTSPGIETKEVFLPIGQISAKAQVSNNVSVAAQYFYEWKPTRVPHSGTYLMGSDTAPTADRLPNGLARLPTLTPKDRGNWGINARWNVEAIESTVGLYYRQFDDYAPETGAQFTPAGFRFVHAQDTKLLGLSFARVIGPVSVGSELSYRKNAHLNSTPTGVSAVNNTGARGNTLHAVVNGIYLLPDNPVSDTGSLVAELAYSRLLDVTDNANLYRGVGYTGCTSLTNPAVPGDKSDACSTRDFLQLAVNFTPQWLNVLPSWDLDLPMTINYGLHGNAPTGGGGFEKALSWSIGAKMTYGQRYEFSLRYADLSIKTKYNAAGTQVVGGNALNSAVGATDRGWLAFTFKTAF